MPATLIRNFAKRSDKPESEVERLWTKTKTLVRDQYGIDKPGEDASEDERSKYYALRVGILKRMLKLESDEQIAKALTELDLGDIASYFLGSGQKQLACAAKQCANNNRKGKCNLPTDAVSIDRNWECGSYARRS